MMGKVSLGQKVRLDRRRLPPIHGADAARSRDRQKPASNQWTGLCIPATKCPPQPQGILNAKERRSNFDRRGGLVSDFSPVDPTLSKEIKCLEESSILRKSLWQHEGRAGQSVWFERCQSPPDTPNQEDMSTNGMGSNTGNVNDCHWKPRVHKIHVDLRAALANVNEPWGSWDGYSSDTGSISGGTPMPREDQEPTKEEEDEGENAQTMRIKRNDCQQNSSPEHSSTLQPTRTRSSHREKGSPYCQSGSYGLCSTLPPPQTSSTYSEQELCYSRNGPSSQKLVSLVEVMGDGTLASQKSRNSNANSASFPKVILKPDYWLPRPGQKSLAEIVAEDEDYTQPEYFVDFQLPTALLLQKVRDQTTSQHHELIAQVLCSLRQGHGADTIDRREMEAPTWRQNPMSDNNGWKTKKTALQNIQRRLAPGSLQAPAKGIAKFTWQKSSPQVAGTVPLHVQRDLHLMGHNGISSYWRMANTSGESQMDTQKAFAMKS
ncbi:uncharacterized protein [Ambystoma mexicanum]|uniref:uncharacterized protein n=1 Tax=Ambystoma mexicanum TaxID=8296 RepID=UPI0037E84F33